MNECHFHEKNIVNLFPLAFSKISGEMMSERNYCSAIWTSFIEVLVNLRNNEILQFVF